jgi:hypothetical protein
MSEYPRLIRRVPEGTLPGADLLSLYDPKLNLLVIDNDKFQRLDAASQRLVLRTNVTALVIVDGVPMPARH